MAECTGDHTYDNYVKLHRTVWAGLQYILFKRGPVASTLFETGGFWYANRSASQPDTQFHLGLGSGIEAGVEKLKNPGLTLNSAFLQPRSRGTVRLQQRRPRRRAPDRPQLLGRPLRPPDVPAGPADGARDPAAAGAAAVPAGVRNPAPDLTTDEQLAEYAFRTCKTDHHPSGACAMGTGAMAVVDPDLRVRGLEGLRVCDSSIMPRVPSSNTNAPTIMVGEKASDLVLGNRAIVALLEHAA